MFNIFPISIITDHNLVSEITFPLSSSGGAVYTSCGAMHNEEITNNNYSFKNREVSQPAGQLNHDTSTESGTLTTVPPTFIGTKSNLQKKGTSSRENEKTTLKFRRNPHQNIDGENSKRKFNFVNTKRKLPSRFSFHDGTFSPSLTYVRDEEVNLFTRSNGLGSGNSLDEESTVVSTRRADSPTVGSTIPADEDRRKNPRRRPNLRS